jgi:1A family penicillin-binding protein
MNPHANPYSTSGPVWGTEGFIGRTDALADVARFLTTPRKKGLILYGHRGIGKTSLLRHLEFRLPREGPYTAVYFDPSAHSGKPLRQLLKALSLEIFESLSIPSVPFPKGDPSLAFESRILDHVLSHLPKQTVLVLLLDEFEAPPQSVPRPSENPFYPYLRFLMSGDHPSLKIISAIGRSPEDLDRIYRTHFEGVYLKRVTNLAPQETAELIRLSETLDTLQWPDAQVSAVIDFTDGHPGLTRSLCRVVWDHLHRIRFTDVPIVRFKDVGQNFPQAIQAADAAFEWLWEGLGPHERVVASFLAEIGPGWIDQKALIAALRQTGGIHLNGGVDRAVRTLEQWGILHTKTGEYRIRINMFSRWIMARKSREQVQEELNGFADRLFDTARESCRRGRLQQAIHLLERAVKLNPRHLKATQLLAKVHVNAGHPESAVQLLEKVQGEVLPAIRPLYIQILVRQAEAENEGGAAHIYEKILSLAPENAEARSFFIEKGHHAFEKNRYTEALVAYRKAGAVYQIKKVEAIIRQLRTQKKIERIKKKRGKRRIAGILLGGASAAALLAVVVAATLTAGYRKISADLPRINSLNDYAPPIVTTVYSDDDRPIAEFYKERRSVIPLDQMPEALIQAFIAAEDARFFTHEGVDLVGIIRAFFKNIEAGTVVQGGSTITQQVVKSFLLSPERSYERKIKEAILAYRIDRAFSKAEILYLYLNQIYLGNGAYGVEAAAENYFGKSAREMTLGECALLAGLSKAPSRDNPFKYPDRAKQRRRYVLSRMAAEGYITPEEAEAAANEKVHIEPRKNLYFDKVPYFTEQVRRRIEAIYGWEALYTGGLKIYTTVNIEMQTAALKAVEKGLQALERRHRYPKAVHPQGALLCLESHTGAVKAMIGGRDFSANQFNRAVQAKRQPGSAFKPIIYAAALDKGYTTVSMLSDTPIVVPDNNRYWKPDNYDGRFTGPIRLRPALAKSRNLPVVKVLRDIGIEYAVEYAHSLGITSNLNRGLSLALGASGVSLLEMVQAYSVFANQGQLVRPRLIRKIADRNGNEIALEHPGPEQVIDSSTAYLMTSLLRSVVENGTGHKMRALNRPSAGKTGTTNDFRDAWYIGYTPEYITGAWVGFDKERSLGKSEAGSKAAGPIWLDFMQRIMEGKPVQAFAPPPEQVVSAKIDAASGLLAGPGSYHILHEYFKEGTVPPRPAPHQFVVTRPEDFFKAGL